MNSPALAPPLLGNTIGSTGEGFVVVAEWQDGSTALDGSPVAVESIITVTCALNQ
jgi:hypothetical protein